MLDDDEYKRWLKSSRRTFDSAAGDLERGDFNWACFKAQQAAELALKALMHGLGMPTHGHSVSRLLSEASRSFEASGDLLQAAKSLDKFYVPTRYPNAWVEGSPEEYYTRRDAEEAIKLAEAIISWVEASWRFLRKEHG